MVFQTIMMSHLTFLQKCHHYHFIPSDILLPCCHKLRLGCWVSSTCIDIWLTKAACCQLRVDFCVELKSSQRLPGIPYASIPHFCNSGYWDETDQTVFWLNIKAGSGVFATIGASTIDAITSWPKCADSSKNALSFPAARRVFAVSGASLSSLNTCDQVESPQLSEHHWLWWARLSMYTVNAGLLSGITISGEII